ncbi:peptidylprolyl isomerase [candidate division KSB1 bacterium]
MKTIIGPVRPVLALLLITGAALVACGSKTEEKPAENPAENRFLADNLTQTGSDKMTAKKGDTVKIMYRGTLNDGSVFDESEEGKPLEFTLGSGQVIPGFDQAVEGMDLNDKKTVTIKAENAYGERNDELIRSFAKDTLPADFKPEKGMTIGVQDGSGRQIPAVVTDLTADSIFVDFNHPLADKDLTFDLELVGIE